MMKKYLYPNIITQLNKKNVLKKKVKAEEEVI